MWEDFPNYQKNAQLVPVSILKVPNQQICTCRTNRPFPPFW